MWISAIASCARRFGRNPYEHGWKSASKMGSSTSLRAAWTTRSVTVAIPSLRSLPLFFGIITCRTGTGRNSPDFSESRIRSRNTPTPIRFSMSATVALSIPGVFDPALAFTRSHPSARNSGSLTRLNRSPNRRERSFPAQRCNLACISRTLRYCAACLPAGCTSVRTAPGFPGASSGITAPSLTDTLPPFPM
jgi:hypothetical protein